MTSAQVFHDPLTDIPNQAYFDERLLATLGFASRSQARVCAGLLDINDFSELNTTLGHAAGDVVLQTVSQRIREVLRSSDFIARTGSDAFSLIMPQIESMAGLELVAQKLLNAIAQPIPVEGSLHPVTVSASLGLALFPDDAGTAADLCQLTEVALQNARSRRTGWSLP